MAAGSTTPHRTDVPEGYRLASTGDLKDPRVARTVAGGVALAVAALVAAALLLDLPFDGAWGGGVVATATVTACLAYMVAHEATHALVLWLLTRVRPTVAVRLPYLVTGSRALLGRRDAVLVALAPLVLWGIALLDLLRDPPPNLFLTIYAVLVLNVAGSAGDVVQAVSFARLPGTALIRDDGRSTSVYLPA